MTLQAPIRLVKIRRSVLVAIALGVITLLLLQFGIGWTLVAAIPWTVGLLMLAARDLEHHLLPKSITYIAGLSTSAVLLVAAAVSGRWARFGIAGLCAIVAAGIFGVIWLVFPGSVGFGDVRLAALASLMLGWFAPILAILGLVAGQLVCFSAVILLAAGGKVNRKTEIPLGTFLALTSIALLIARGR